MGQSFSTTKKGLELQNRECNQIADVCVGKTCFTDGIGIIAPWLVEKLCRELRPDDDSYRPCALQIRLGGFKGRVSSITVPSYK